MWNAAGEKPTGLACFQPIGAEPVWTGAWSLLADQQGLLVPGAFVQLELRRKHETQDQLLTRLPAVRDLQYAWLLLLCCASPRANYLLRMFPPGATEAFAHSSLCSLVAWVCTRPHELLGSCQASLVFGEGGERIGQATSISTVAQRELGMCGSQSWQTGSSVLGSSGSVIFR